MRLSPHLLFTLTIVLSLGLVFGGGVFLNYYLLDGLTGLFFTGGFEEDTEYAPGYSDEGFLRVRRGMSEQEVLAILGSPLGTVDLAESRQSWVYSRSPGHKSYRVRCFVFEDRRVAEIIHEFYID